MVRQGNLVESMNVVRERFPDALLLIAGKGPMADELQKLIVEHGLESHIRLLGFVPDELLPAAYRAADVSVVPSTSLEGFGLTTVESLASGTPVLVTPVGGLPEVVSDLSTDLVFPDSRSDTMGDYLSDVLDGRLRVPSSEACSDYAANRYSWPVVAGRVRAVYRRVLS